MGALIKHQAAADDLSYRPAYHDMLREQEFRDAAQERRQAIAQCTGCGDDGYLLGPDRTPVEPLVRCRH